MRSIEGFRWVSQPHALLAGGHSRRFRVYRPSGLGRAGAVPLVLFLHGGFGSGAQAEYAYGWDDAADRYGFVVAYPDGIGRSWNAGACCGPARSEGVDDVGFLRALVEQVGDAERIDPDRVYCTGISNGAMMAYRLACELPRLLAAIGPVAGTMVCPCPQPEPTSVLHIHGLEDAMVPFVGGIGRESGTASPRPSVLSVLDVWRQAGG
ncbi:MAG: alpha/beta hydrolase family esterase, partial [Actinomycetota bacterium]